MILIISKLACSEWMKVVINTVVIDGKEAMRGPGRRSERMTLALLFLVPRRRSGFSLKSDWRKKQASAYT